MSIRPIPPGKRHGNKVWYARISVRGRRVEISTDTRDKRLALRFAEAREREFYERHILGDKTVAQCVDQYIAFRRPRKLYERHLLRIRGLIGKRPARGISQADFDECARFLYPGLTNESWNTLVYTPLQAALRHSGFSVVVTNAHGKRSRSTGA